MAREAYDEWETGLHLSAASPEAYWAEQAWNAALEAVRHEMCVRGLDYEAGIVNKFVTDLPARKPG